MLYCAGFDISTLSVGTLTLATAGESNAVVTLASITGAAIDGGAATSMMFHGVDTSQTCTAQDGSGATMLGRWSSIHFPRLLRTAMRAAATTASWSSPTDLDVTWSSTTGLFTYTFTSAFSMTWSSSAGRALCGMAANVSGDVTYAGTVVPTYVISPTLTATSEHTPNYEPNGIANHMRTDTNGGYGVSRERTPLYRDWLQQFESPEKTIESLAESTHPYTFEKMFRDCRGSKPFLVIDGFGEGYHEAFSFRSEGTSWNPQRSSPNDGTSYHIPFRCVVEGTFG